MNNEDDNIQFEQMPDLDWSWGSKQEAQTIEKEYDSLYDELIDKCSPSRFPIESVGLEKFNIANDIYAQLLECKRIAESMGKNMVSDDSLKILRNRAIEELGVHISTKKKFNELKSFLNPEQYINRQPYDKVLVENAGKLYSQLLQSQDDIKALEQLENLVEIASIFEEYEFQNLDPENYLEKYPDGIHVEEVEKIIRQRKQDEQQKEYEYYKKQSAADYLQQYPNGHYCDEAKCFLYGDNKAYLKQYPNGRYKDEAENDITATRILVVVGILFLVFVIVIAVTNSK